VRHPGERFVERHENEWPLARTQWTKYHLDATDLTLSDGPAQQDGTVSYAGFGDGVTFLTAPVPSPTELTGPLAAKLFVSSATEDADLFLVVRVFGPDLKEVVFHGALDPHTPVAQGWLRASHRKLDKELTLPYRPYHTHDEIEPLEPGEVYELDVEIWPTCIVVPPGHRIGLTVRGKDYVYPGDISDTGEKLAGVWSGVGPFKHDDPRDRPAQVFGGEVTVHTGPDRPSHLLLPVIPER
jgi:predicted acyl esterase